MRALKDCAVEVCSFSKIAGFTGTRCGYTVVPQAIVSDGQSLNKMWLRRQTTKFNGVAYVVQRGAEAVFTEEGMKEIQHNLDYYRQNAAVIAAALDEAGVWYCGGKNSPYIRPLPQQHGQLGSFLTGCWRPPMLLAPLARALASAARGISA